MAPSEATTTYGKSIVGLYLTLALIGALAPFSIDTYLPAMPEMAAALGTTDAALKLTISGFLLGTAVFPLFIAPLGDTIGRRAILTWMLAAFVVISAACALVQNVETLIALRFFQAGAAGVAMVMTRAILADLFRGDALSRATSVVMILFSTAPIVAPLLGAGILQFGSWRWVFGFLSGAGIFALLFGRTISETLQPSQRKPYNMRAILKGYLEILREPFARNQIMIGSWFSFQFFAMLASAPFIFIDHFGMDPVAFSVMFASIAISAYLGNFINAVLVTRVGYPNMLRGAIWMTVLTAVLMLIFSFGEIGGRWAIYGAMLLTMGTYHIAISATTAGVMDSQGHRAGAAGAVIAFMRFSMGALGAALTGMFGTTHPWTYAVVVALAAGAMLMLLGRVGRYQGPSEPL